MTKTSSSKDILKKIKDIKKKIIDNDPNLEVMSDIGYNYSNHKTELLLKKLRALQWKYLIAKINETNDKALEKLKDNLSIVKDGYGFLCKTSQNCPNYDPNKSVETILYSYSYERLDFYNARFTYLGEVFGLPEKIIKVSYALVGNGSHFYYIINDKDTLCTNIYFNEDRGTNMQAVLKTVIENLDILIEDLPKDEFLKMQKFVFLDRNLKPITINWYKEKWGIAKPIYVIFEMGPYDENYYVHDYNFFDNYDDACNTLSILKGMHKGSKYEIREFTKFGG